jgi:hypothetical protein
MNDRPARTDPWHRNHCWFLAQAPAAPEANGPAPGCLEWKKRGCAEARTASFVAEGGTFPAGAAVPFSFNTVGRWGLSAERKTERQWGAPPHESADPGVPSVQYCIDNDDIVSTTADFLLLTRSLVEAVPRGRIHSVLAMVHNFAFSPFHSVFNPSSSGLFFL